MGKEVGRVEYGRQQAYGNQLSKTQCPKQKTAICLLVSQSCVACKYENLTSAQVKLPPYVFVCNEKKKITCSSAVLSIPSLSQIRMNIGATTIQSLFLYRVIDVKPSNHRIIPLPLINISFPICQQFISISPSPTNTHFILLFCLTCIVFGEV